MFITRASVDSSQEIKKRGGNVIVLNAVDNFYNIVATLRLYNLVKKIQPHIIHSMLFNANFHARIVGIMLKKPVIIEEHGLYIWKKWYHILIDKILAKSTKKVIAVSDSVKKFIINQEQLDSDKVIVLYDCVDPNFVKSKTKRGEERKKLSIADDVFLIGTVGNLREEKGHRILFHALKQVLSTYKNLKLFIVGDGPLYKYLLEQTKRLGIEKSVVFLKKKSNIAGFLRALDLFVLPSTSEGLGIALIEAIAAQLPCIASNVGGIKEIAEGVEDVTLVKPNNPMDLSNAIMFAIEKNKRLMRDHDFAEEMTIKYIFTPKTYLSHLEQIYKEAIKV